MVDTSYFRQLARRCRALAQITSQTEVMYQLQVWAIELDRDADEAEGRADEPVDQARRNALDQCGVGSA